MSREKYDVVIVGGGPVRRAELSVAMIESRDLGGTCPNRGCTPRRCWLLQGRPFTTSSALGFIRLQWASQKLDWGALIAREKDMIRDIPEDLAHAIVRRKVEVIKGCGTFAGRMRFGSGIARFTPAIS